MGGGKVGGNPRPLIITRNSCISCVAMVAVIVRFTCVCPLLMSTYSPFFPSRRQEIYLFAKKKLTQTPVEISSSLFKRLTGRVSDSKGSSVEVSSRELNTGKSIASVRMAAERNLESMVVRSIDLKRFFRNC